jgi:ATP synthase protein I
MTKTSDPESPSGPPGRPRDDPEDARLAERLSQLSRRLATEEEKARPSAPRGDADVSGFAKGFRYAGDILGGVIVGFGMGWLIDRGLGSSPWGMIVFTLLGFSAGVLNLMRSIGLVAQPGRRERD